MNLRLECWSVRSRPLGHLEPPEEYGVCLYGFVTGHPLHGDGREVLTSPICWAGDHGVVTRSGSEYELGSVDPSYEQCYPGARQRLLQQLDRRPPRIRIRDTAEAIAS